MSAVIVVSVEDLERIVRTAVAEALAAGAPARSDEWIAVRKCGLPATSIRRLAKEGKLRSVILGRERFVHRADLEKHLETIAAKAPSTEPRASIEEPVPADPFERARLNARARSGRAA